MIQLISINEKKELCLSTDPAIKEPEGGRQPCRAIPKKECKIKGTPLCFTVRPLRSREMVKVLEMGQQSVHSASIEACEIGVSAITGEDLSAVEADAICETLAAVPYLVLIAVGSYIIDQSSLSQDPTEPNE